MSLKGQVLCVLALVLMVGVSLGIGGVAIPAIWPSGVRRLVAQSGFGSLVLMSLVCYVRTMFTDPGFVASQTGACADVYVETLKRKGLTVCDICHNYKPSRAHHCSQCRRCVYLMDHHCPWLNNCIGANNQKFFVLFLLYTSLTALFGVGITITSMVRLQEHTDSQVVVLGVILVLAAAFGGFTCQLLCEQWYFVYMNTSLVDILQGREVPRVSHLGSAHC